MTPGSQLGSGVHGEATDEDEQDWQRLLDLEDDEMAWERLDDR
jgi:hypothetical protein